MTFHTDHRKKTVALAGVNFELEVQRVDDRLFVQVFAQEIGGNKSTYVVGELYENAKDH